jgi:archaellum biogenesis protein FlaJ (TadC family)
MKKIILALVCLFTLNVSAQKVINYPFGAAQTFTAAASGTVVVTVNNQMSVMSAPTLTAAATLSLTASSNLKAGAILLVAVKTTSTEVTTFAGSVVAPAVTGVTGKTWTQAFLYNGTNFYPMGVKQQVD